MDKPKFNFIDAAILLVVILVIIAGIFLLSSGSGDTSQQADIFAEYKIQFTKSDLSVANKFTEAASNGESVWVGAKERAHAELVDVLVEPAREITINSKKEIAEWSEIPEKYDITLTLRSRAKETDSQVFAENVPIRVGEEFVVRGKGFAGFGFLIDLKLVD